METWMIILLGVIGFVVIIFLYVAGVYNKLIVGRNKTKDQWSQIDVLLKRRADLIPNLVETVKGYAKHEKETFDAVISARSKALGAKTTEEEMKANGELEGALSRLLMVVENYPELKANTNFMDLQSQLKETEDKIAYARQFYNDAVLKYNNLIELFPSNLVASAFKFEKALFFAANEKDKENPQVKF